MILSLEGVSPTIAPDAFVAPTAVVIGNVSIGPEASIWFGAVLRGDDPDHAIVIGARTSIQDNCVIHVGRWGPTLIGSDVTVGHGAKLESCVVGDGCLIGMNAVVLQEADIGEGCLIAAGAIVLEKAMIPAASLVAGVPARVRKSLDGSSSEWLSRSPAHYVALSRQYLADGIGRVPEDQG